MRSDEGGQVSEWAEGARRRHRVTGADEHAASFRGMVAKRVDDARLADARLAVKEQDATVSSDRAIHRVVEVRELTLALEQLHSAMVLAAGRERNGRMR